jgi:hypothetical protein
MKGDSTSQLNMQMILSLSGLTALLGSLAHLQPLLAHRLSFLPIGHWQQGGTKYGMVTLSHPINHPELPQVMPRSRHFPILPR